MVRHNVILSFTVAKTIYNVEYDLQLALVWAAAGKNVMEVALIKKYLEKSKFPSYP